MPISIYPPTLQSSQPAFLYNVTEYPIYFTLQKITAFQDIGHVQVRVVRQTNNKSVVNTSIYPDGTIYKAPSEITQLNGRYQVNISRAELIEPWQQGQLYKIQMRFGVNPKFSDISQFAAWKREQIEGSSFSEWSTVMIIKPIDQPQIAIQNAQNVKQDVIASERLEATLTPLFESSYYISSINNEPLDKYKFDLYKGDEIDISNFLESSGWIQYNASQNASISHRFKTVLENREIYTVVYSIRTVNGYEEVCDPYSFTASQSYLDPLEETILTIEDDSVYCRENGCINIYLSSSIALSGSYIVTRSSEKSNYTIWEDLQFLTYANKNFDNDLVYQDFTIESGIKYKYAFQQENAKGLRTTPLYESGNSYHWVDFEYSYIYRDGLQLKLKFNQTMSSFKHTVLASKQDTLGDRYPHLVKNGYAYYAEFPVAGLISFQMDDDQTFFTIGEEGYYYKDELIVPIDKFDYMDGKREPNTETGEYNVVLDKSHPTINNNLTSNNVFIERKFREKVEEFLNDFDYKLYKSPTEGNFIVGLMNISLTPKKELGRMLFEFTATAYEVLENNISNLDKSGIINIGHFETLASSEIEYAFGQIAGIYTTNNRATNNIYNLIKEQEEVNIGSNYKMQLRRLRSLWIERYPSEDLTIEITELLAQKSKLEQEGKDSSDIELKISELESLQFALKQKIGNIILSINGQQIIVQPNRIYSLREPVTSFEVISAPYPLILNYVCELNRVEDTSVGVISAIDASQIWGQISGVFTGTDKILKTYNYDYGPGQPPLQVFNGHPDKTIIKDKKGNIILDNTNFNVYKTVNIYEIIKEDTQRQVELIYNTSGPFKPDSNGDLTVDNIYYRFSDIVEFDIEADPGTRIIISKNSDGSNPQEILIGPTSRYVLKPIENMIRFIALKEPQFAVINYKCYTNQRRYGGN